MQKKYTVLGLDSIERRLAVEKNLLALTEVLSVTVNFRERTVLVILPDTPVSEQPLFKAVQKAGCKLLPFSAVSAREKDCRQTAPAFLVFAPVVSVFFVLILTVLIAGVAAENMSLPLFVHPKNAALFGLLLLLPILLVNCSCFKALLSGHFKNPLPTAVSVTVLLASATFHTVKLFFAEGIFPAFSLMGVGVLLTVYSFEHWVCFHTRTAFPPKQAFFKSLSKKPEVLLPEKVTVLKNQKKSAIPLSSLQPGDKLLIHSGNTIPADGKVLSGNALIQPAFLNEKEESYTVSQEDFIYAGSIVREGQLLMVAQKVCTDTLLFRLSTGACRSSFRKEDRTSLTDRIGGYYLPCFLSFILFSGAVWLFISRDLSSVLRITVSLFALGCPCTLGFCSPTAFLAAALKAKKKGIFFKSPRSVEQCSEVCSVVFPDLQEKNEFFLKSETKLKEQDVHCTFSEKSAKASDCLNDRPDTVSNEKKDARTAVVILKGNIKETLAMANASFSFALSQVPSIVIENADALILERNPEVLGTAVFLARQALTRKKQNLAFVLLISLAGLLLAAAGKTGIPLFLTLIFLSLFSIFFNSFRP